MTYRVANKLNQTFKLDEKYDTVLATTGKSIEDAMCKGYVYANLYFYDETQKEVDKLRRIVKKVHDEVVMELGLDPDNPTKLLLEMSVRVTKAIGEDSLDALVKEFLAEKSRHMALMIEKSEQDKLDKICEAIFMELTASFYDMTFQNARDLDNDVKTFRFSKEYVEHMTDRQKRLLAPALKMIGFENQLKLNNFVLDPDWTVKYVPERLPHPFMKQEETIKDQIKTFIQQNG